MGECMMDYAVRALRSADTADLVSYRLTGWRAEQCERVAERWSDRFNRACWVLRNRYGIGASLQSVRELCPDRVG